jgi:hypothetical protein
MFGAPPNENKVGAGQREQLIRERREAKRRLDFARRRLLPFSFAFLPRMLFELGFLAIELGFLLLEVEQDTGTTAMFGAPPNENKVGAGQREQLIRERSPG